MTNQKKPEITLKSIKHMASLSEETYCYSARLYVDGELWGMVRNAGHGGCDEFIGENGRSYSDLHDLNLRIAATYDPIEGYGSSLECDLELICHDIIGKYLEERDFKRWLRKPVFIADDGSIRSYSLPSNIGLQTALKQLKARNPKIEFLNDLPQDQAFERLRAAS